jgi:hypothetical protein
LALLLMPWVLWSLTGDVTDLVHRAAGAAVDLPLAALTAAAVGVLSWGMAPSPWRTASRGAAGMLLLLPLSAAAGLWSLPAWALAAGGVLWVRRRSRAAADPLALVVCRAAGSPRPVRLAGEDRFLHLHIVGPTGSGKTSAALLPMILQDLARPGVGLTVLEPKGDLVEAVAAACTRAGRPFRLLDPRREDCPRVNPLEGEDTQAAESLAYVYERLFAGDNPFYRSMGTNLLRHAVLALKAARARTADLPELLRLFRDADFLKEVLNGVADPAVREFFRQGWLRWPERTRQEYAAGVLDALAGLLANPRLARVLSGPGELHPREVLAEAQVLLAVLPPGEFGRGARMLGTFLLYQLQFATFGRGPVRPPHFLYVDEFQDYATGGFGEFLAAARSFGVGAVLAHQNLGQLDSGLRDVVLANARNRVVFGGTSARDAAELAELFGRRRRREHLFDAWGLPRGSRFGEAWRFTPTMVRELPRGRVLVQLVHRGSLQPPLLGEVAPAPLP